MIKNYTIFTPFSIDWNWSADYQRQTCLLLSQSNSVIAYMQKDSSFFLKQKKGNYPSKKNISFVQPKNLIPFQRLSTIRQINEKLSLFRYTKNNRKKQILWIFDPDFYWMIDCLPNHIAIFDCVDYFHSRNSDENKRIQNNQTKMLKKADLVFVNSQTLYKLHRKERKELTLVPQGFRLSTFKKQKKTKMITKKKPVIGFVGGINYRLDYLLLEEIIKNNPQWVFVFWGPEQKDDQDTIFYTQKKILALKRYKNTIWGKSEHRQEIPHIIKQFDIAIIPYDSSQEFNQMCFPMKMFEYFYMGKPVISTPIKELYRYQKYVKIGATTKRWKYLIELLLQKKWSDSLINEQKQLAIQNSWEKKIECISKEISLFRTM